MEKIKLPPTCLEGTPLTVEEMKSILGGQIDQTRICSCYFRYSSGVQNTSDNLYPPTVSVKAADESTCIQECQNECRKNDKCVDWDYIYYSHF